MVYCWLALNLAAMLRMVSLILGRSGCDLIENDGRGYELVSPTASSFNGPSPEKSNGIIARNSTFRHQE